MNVRSHSITVTGMQCAETLVEAMNAIADGDFQGMELCVLVGLLKIRND